MDRPRGKGGLSWGSITCTWLVGLLLSKDNTLPEVALTGLMDGSGCFLLIFWLFSVLETSTVELLGWGLFSLSLSIE